jgi:hypothetical protein|uniref:Uncharacterized protein n=1 Tax=Picea glauca TaxID=3330 RepID=A0A124GP23_PICGL|nr:hypothetical protein ABT39_MTgene476 [Picea glauca]QHR91240.1 hypothetical protein Q903MT_gene5272 [Picea sitchensis]
MPQNLPEVRPFRVAQIGFMVCPTEIRPVCNVEGHFLYIAPLTHACTIRASESGLLDTLAELRPHCDNESCLLDIAAAEVGLIDIAAEEIGLIDFVVEESILVNYNLPHQLKKLAHDRTKNSPYALPNFPY